MNISSKRKAIASVYPGWDWRYKCFHIFKPRQVAAIYNTMERNGLFEKKIKKDDGVQISMWDLGIDI